MKKRILNLIIVLVLILGFTVTNVYGFTEMDGYDSILNKLKFNDNVVTDVDLNQQKLIDERSKLGINGIDVCNVSGFVINLYPFTVAVDMMVESKNVFEGQTRIEYAQIINPTWENYDATTGYYKSTPSLFTKTLKSGYSYIGVFEGYTDNVKKYLSLSSDINKTYGSNSYNAKYTTTGYEILEVKDKGWYIGETVTVNGSKIPLGRGAYASKKDISESIYADGIFLANGNLSGFAYVDLGYMGDIKYNLGVQKTPTQSFFAGVFHNGKQIDDFLGSAFWMEKDPTFLRLYADNPGVMYVQTPAPYYREHWAGGEGEWVYSSPEIEMTNFNTGKTITKNGTYYFPMREVVEYYGHTVKWDAINGTTISEVISITPGSNKIITRGNEATLSNPIEIINGVTYVPIDFLQKAFSENKFTWTIKDKSGCTIIDIIQGIAG